MSDTKESNGTTEKPDVVVVEEKTNAQTAPPVSDKVKVGKLLLSSFHW